MVCFFICWRWKGTIACLCLLFQLHSAVLQQLTAAKQKPKQQNINQKLFSPKTVCLLSIFSVERIPTPRAGLRCNQKWKIKTFNQAICYLLQLTSLRKFSLPVKYVITQTLVRIANTGNATLISSLSFVFTGFLTLLQLSKNFVWSWLPPSLSLLLSVVIQMRAQRPGIPPCIVHAEFIPLL